MIAVSTVLLFFKAHIKGYTRKDGTVVRPHEDRRQASLFDLPPMRHPPAAAPAQAVLFFGEPVTPGLPIYSNLINNESIVNQKESDMEATKDASTDYPSPDWVPEFAPRPNVRDVPEYLVPAIQAMVDKVNKRAAKLGVEGFTLSKSETFTKEKKTEGGKKYLVTMVTLTIDGGTVKVPGHDLVGRVDFEDGLTIVNTRPGAEMPPRYRSVSKTCDHCHTDRDRNAVFVFKRDADGEHIQVGRSCLRDFMGHSPAAALWAANEYGGMFGDIDDLIESEEKLGGSRVHQVVALSSVMTAAVFSVRKLGFVSRKKAEDSAGKYFPTSGEVSHILFDDKAAEAYRKEVTEADSEKAAAVVAWIQSEWGGKEDQSDFEFNAVQLTSRDTVNPKRIGLLTALVASYDRANEERVAKAARVNAHVGAVGERREFNGVFSGLNQFDTHFGVMFIARIDTPEGLVVYRGSSIWWPVPIDVGTPVQFVGTIAEHGDYKGTKQTMVSRCKMGPLAVKAPKRKAKPVVLLMAA